MCRFKCTCSVIKLQDGLTAYCKQQIIQLYFDRRISYSNVAKVLAAEGFRVPKRMVWATIQKYKIHGATSCLPGSGRPFKVPLTCKTFIAEKGSVLLVEKLRGTLSCKQWLHGEKFEDLVAKIYRYVISDVIKTGLSAVRHDVTRGTEVDG